MSALLACLLAAFLALVGLHGSWLGLGGGGSQAGGAALPAGCPGREAPEVMRASTQDLRALRDELLRISPGRVGREYEAGPVTTAQLWTDNEPGHAPLPNTSSRTLPAGYEIRWWALNRAGSEDDLGGDVLEFATPARAERALALAVSPKCRRGAVAQPASYPARATNLLWVNPDRAHEWDVLFVRGRRLFRIVDVPPSYPNGRRAEARRRDLSITTVNVLACSLPEAGCRAAPASPRDTSLASLDARSPIVSGPPPTLAQATAFAHGVNLRAYLVPGMAETGREGPAEDRGERSAFVTCAGEPRSPRAVAAIHSPAFAYRRRREYELVYSTVAVFRSQADARRLVAAVASARARACVERDYRRALRHMAATRGRLHLGRVALVALPTPVPSAYRGLGPYDAAALRITAQARYTTRRGREAWLSIYVQAFEFAYGRAVVQLTALTGRDPFPDANETFLESALVGRTQAHAG